MSARIAAAEAMTDHGETPPFLVVQAQPPTVQLGLKNPVLFPSILDHIALFPLEPAEQHRDDQCGEITHGVFLKLGGCSFQTVRA
jgi:hypothetical protein